MPRYSRTSAGALLTMSTGCGGPERMETPGFPRTAARGPPADDQFQTMVVKTFSQVAGHV